jgi:5-methylcytosine-specific restriction protein B
MPRADWCRSEIYEFFDRWRQNCLIEDGGVFSAAHVWTDDNLSVLQTTLGAELIGEGTFFEKLRTQLEPHPPEIRQLGVEIVYVEYLGERDTSVATKQAKLQALLDLLPEDVSVPAGLWEILDGGIASYGPGKSYRDAYVRFLLKLARAAKEEVRAGRAEVLEDPWLFRNVVARVRTSTDGLEANAVLHACFPDEFDVMISGGHRDKLLRRFGSAPLVAEANEEEKKLLAVRDVLRSCVPEPIAEPYDDAVRPTWDGPASPEWDDLIQRALPLLPATADQHDGPQPPVDADLLERLQHALTFAGDWTALLKQAAVRVAAAGGVAHSWQALATALRDAADRLPAPPSPEPEPGVGTAAPLPRITAELAADLLFPQSWLQTRLDLLEARRQIVLYGPPGTGKTWLARRLAAHAFEADAVRLVQFHPSYTYEDFVEGYRPVTDGGALTYALVHGPLRELTAHAHAHPDRPHLLIIDEINRGNLPKIFGELYFLLEYRDEPLRLQYSSHEEFRLPPNLHVIGTMNTADRSIALLDAALRRRFAFIELSPNAEPIRGLLGRWLERQDLDPEPAALLETLNAMLLEADGDADLAIGPSYFMNDAGTSPDLETVWEHDILPLLIERFHGTMRDVVLEFGLGAVQAEAARRADVTDAGVA